MAQEKAPNSIKKPHLREYYRNQQGKDYIQYGGLIAEFHSVNDAWMDAWKADRVDQVDQIDLRGIEVTVLQLPSAENGNMAVASAKVRMSNGTVYIEVGDADDKNTNRMVAPAKIRMAATRAKGRALRDALNIGETMYEELPDADLPDEDDDAPQPRAETPAQTPAEPGPVTAEQARTIKDLARELVRPVAISKSMTEETAATLIEQLEAELLETKAEKKAIYDQVASLIPAYAETSGKKQNEVADEIKQAAQIKTAKIGEAPIEQLRAALEYLQGKGVAA